MIFLFCVFVVCGGSPEQLGVGLKLLECCKSWGESEMCISEVHGRKRSSYEDDIEK